MLLKLVALFVFMLGVLVAALWVTIELAGAVAAGADNTWYLAVGLSLAAAVLMLVVLIRSRTRAMVALMAAATVVLAAVVLTYPDGGTACTPTTAQGQSQGQADATTGEDFSDLFEQDTGAASTTTTTDCS